jgi:hypothetical protein
MPQSEQVRTAAGRRLALLVPLLALGIAWLAAGGASAQLPGSGGGSVISGLVVDSATGRPIDKANVFLGSTILGASTEQDGQFILRGIPNGSYQLACSRVGYARSLVRVEFPAADSIHLDISLVQRPISMDTVRVTGMRPEEWRRYLKVFLGAFLGNRRNAKLCVLANPEVLDFRMDRREGLLAASTDSMLHVENRALGYRLDILLLEFSWDVKRDNGRWAIVPRFTPYDSSDADQQALWTKNRHEAFAGSLDHYLAALATGRPEDQGFVSAQRGRGLPPRVPKLEPVSGTPLISVTFPDWLRIEYFHSTPPTKGLIRLVEDCAVIDSLGNNFTPYCFETAGDWAEYGVADLLPRDWH